MAGTWSVTLHGFQTEADLSFSGGMSRFDVATVVSPWPGRRRGESHFVHLLNRAGTGTGRRAFEDGRDPAGSYGAGGGAAVLVHAIDVAFGMAHLHRAHRGRGRCGPHRRGVRIDGFPARPRYGTIGRQRPRASPTPRPACEAGQFVVLHQGRPRRSRRTPLTLSRPPRVASAGTGTPDDRTVPASTAATAIKWPVPATVQPQNAGGRYARFFTGG